jgi:hypothetical protein
MVVYLVGWSAAQMVELWVWMKVDKLAERMVLW